MALIILGFLVLIGAIVLRKNMQYGRYANILRGIAALLFVAGLLMKSIVQINPGEIGVKTLFGKVQDKVLGSGLHLINPLMEIRRLDIKTQNYTMSGQHDEGQQAGDDA